MRVAERFRWVSRVSAWTGAATDWTEVEIEDGILRKDGEEAIVLSDLRRLRFRRNLFTASEDPHAFDEKKASLILEDGARRLVLEGSLHPDVEGDPFPAAVARVLEACAEACPELAVSKVRYGRIIWGVFALLFLLITVVALASDIRTGGESRARAALMLLFFMLSVVGFGYDALRSRPRIDSLGVLVGLLDGVVRRGLPAVGAIP